MSAWTLPELRRVLWMLAWMQVLSAQQVWHWSVWRRCQQAKAQRHHYRRRGPPSEVMPSQPLCSAVQKMQLPLPISEQQWQTVHPLLPAPKLRRRHPVDMRCVIDAIVYQQATQCLWRSLPKRFPAWGTVYMHFSAWREQGIWEEVLQVIGAAGK